MGTHPIHGVEGYRTKDFTDGSFTLPDALKERLRPMDNTNSNMQDEDVEEDYVQKATKMTNFVKSIYVARDWVRTGNRGKETDIFVKFIRSTGLGEEEAWTTLGDLPTNFITADHGFVVKVPFVTPGTQLILWNTWYTNAAGPGKSVVATMDLTPVSYLDPEELAWYQYLSQHAPSDFGGSGGAYQTFLLKASEKAVTYGLPDEYMEMLTCGYRHMATDSGDLRGLGTLFDTQKLLLHQQGYLVIDIPPHLVEHLPVDKSLGNIDQFHKVLKTFTAPRRNTTKDPLNPFVKQVSVNKTRIPYTLEPFHVAFQYTSFLHNLLSSFYQPGRIEPLLVIQEPFQQPQSSKWGTFTMNNQPMHLIPWAHRQYRARHGLVSF
jgi:hypothetical protein